MKSDDNELFLKKELQTMSQTLQSIIHVSNFELSRSTHRHKPSYRGTVGRIKTHLRRKTHNTTYEPFVTLFILLFFSLFVLVIVQFHLLVYFPLPAGSRSEDAKIRRQKLLLRSAGRESPRNLSKKKKIGIEIFRPIFNSRKAP